MPKREITILLKIEDGNSDAVVNRWKNRFEELEDISDRAVKSVNKVFSGEISGAFASGGEREYLESVRRLQPELRQLHQNIKDGSLDFNDYQKRLDLLSPITRKAIKDAERLGNVFRITGDSAKHGTNGLAELIAALNLSEKASDAFAQKFRKSSEEALEFGKSIASISTITDDSFNLSKARKELLLMPAEFGRTSEAAKGMYRAISSGVEANQSLEYTASSAKAAKAGLASISDTVDASTSVINSYGLEVKRVDDVYDLMFQTVKDGKIEFQQLAGFIGDTSNIAAQGGVKIEELFAVIATATTTTKPATAIEAFRFAISSIVKPSKEAVDLAKQLGLEFDAAALRSKGFAAFLSDVMAKTQGNTEKLAVLFGDIKGLNSILSITGSQTETFTRELERMKIAFGQTDVYGKAFEKSQQSLSAQLDTSGVLIEKGFLRIFSLIEPVLSLVLAVFIKFPTPVFLVAAAIAALTAAHFLYNSQLVFAAVQAIPAFIKGLTNTISLMFSLRTLTAGSATAMIAFTAGWGILALAVLAVVASLYNYNQEVKKTADEHLKGIEAAKGQADAITQQKQALIEFQEQTKYTGDETAGLTLRQKDLAAIYETLDTSSKNRVDELVGERGAIGALADEIERLNKAKVNEVESRVTSLVKTTAESYKKLEEARKAAELAERNHANAERNTPRPIIDTESGAVEFTTQQFERLRKKKEETAEASREAQKEFDAYKSTLLTGFAVLQQYNTGSQTNIENFIRGKIVTQQLETVSEDYISTLNQGTKTQNNFAEGIKKVTGELGLQTEAVANLKEELDRLNSRNQAGIDAATLSILKDVADGKIKASQAGQAAREKLKSPELRQIVEQSKELRQAEKEVKEIFNPSDNTQAPKTSRSKTTDPKPNFNRERRNITGNANYDRWVYEASQKYNIDPKLVFAQMLQESNNKFKAVSHKGASGLMQLMPATAREMGIIDIFDPKQNIFGGVKYLRRQFDKFKLPELALAAYNAGPGAVSKYGNTIPPYKETREYVQRISANYAKLQGRERELGSGFSYEKSLENLLQNNQKESDRLTKEALDKRTEEAYERLRTTGRGMSDSAMSNYIRMEQEKARAQGIEQPFEEDLRRELESMRRPAGTPIKLPEVEKSVLEMAREKYNLEEREGELLGRQISMKTTLQAKQEDYLMALREARQEIREEAGLIAQRNLDLEASVAFAREQNTQTREMGDLEIQLMNLRRQSNDDEFTDKRRLLASTREQVELERSIIDTQDKIANSGINDGLKIRAAFLEDILKLREQETEAVIRTNRAQLALSQSMQVSNNQIRAGIYEHIAGANSINDAHIGGFNKTFDALNGQINESLEQLDQKTKGYLSFVIEPLKAYQTNALSNVWTNVVDAIFPAEMADQLKSTGNPLLDETRKQSGYLERLADALAPRSPLSISAAGGGLREMLGKLFNPGSGASLSGAGGSNLVGSLASGGLGLGGGLSSFGSGSSFSADLRALGGAGQFFNSVNGISTATSGGGGGMWKGWLDQDLFKKEWERAIGRQGTPAAAGLFSPKGLLSAFGPMAAISGGMFLGNKSGGLLGNLGGLLAGGVGLSALAAMGIGGASIFGSTLGATSTGGLFGLGGALSGLGGFLGSVGGAFGATAGTASSIALGATVIGAPVAAAMLVGGWLLGRNKTRRQEETIRNQAMVDTLNALNDIKSKLDARPPQIDSDSAVSQAREIESTYFNEMGQLTDKKTRGIAIKDGNERVRPLVQAIQISADAARVFQATRQKTSSEFTGQFAAGVYMDSSFRTQYAEFKRRNGLMPGAYTGRDYIKALIGDGEMVLNAAQQARVIANAQAGHDNPFSDAGIPNYKPAAEMPKFASGVNFNSPFTSSSGANSKQSDEPTIVNVTNHFDGFKKLVRTEISSPQTRRFVVGTVKTYFEEGRISED